MPATLIRKGQLKSPLDIVNTDIATNAAIATSKLAQGADFILKDGTVSMTGALQMGTNKITGLGTPTAGTDAATKDYVDSVSQGLDIKASVRVATTANITLSGTQTIDGVSLSTSDRVLVKDQTIGAQNGIYLVQSGAWARAADADANGEVTAGLFTFVEEGTSNQDSGWVLTTNNPITLGTTALTFTQFSGAGSVIAGAGLTQSGNTINVGTANNSRIVVNANDIDLAQITPNTGSGTAGINFAQSVTVDTYGRTTGVITADVRAASTTQTGIVQLSDLVNSTSTSLAATANAVKVTYDLAAGALQRSGGTMTGKLVLASSNSTTAGLNLGPGASPTLANRVVGDIWLVSNTGEINFFVNPGGSEVTRTLLHSASVLPAANIQGTVAVANGGTGQSSYTDGQLLIGNSTGNTLTKTTLTAGTGITITNGAGSITIQTSGAVYGATNFVTREVPTGAINGANTTFTLANTPTSGSEEVYVNGVLQNAGSGNDYTISTNTITFLWTPQTGDVIVVNYRK